jgi:hypothetical protein
MPFLDYREREIIFREAVLGFMGVKGKNERHETDEEFKRSLDGLF